MNIVLTGFMATGKTEISKALAKKIGYERADTDDMIVSAAKMSINDIFADRGEEYFRKVETEIIKKAAELKDTVISTGGGVVLRKENMDELRKSGVIVNLSADFKVIEARLKVAAATRPLLKNASIEETKKRFDDRKPFYDNCDIKITVTDDKTPSEHADIIRKELIKNNLL